MKRRALVALAAFGLMVGTATPQTMVHQDVQSVLRAAYTAMGADDLQTIQFSGNGTTRAVGQSFSIVNDWPRFDMPSYTRVIDYDANYSREQLTRTQGDNPPRGGGGTPLQGEDQRSLIVNGDFAWDIRGDDVVPVPAAAEQRLIEIMLTPHGFIKAALEAADTTAVTMMMAVDDPNIGQDAGDGGRKVTYVAFTALDKYKVTGAINDRNLVERVQTWIPDPALGDLYWQWDYTDYRAFGDVMFPGHLHQHTGYRRTNGHHGYNIFVTDVKSNPGVTVAGVPDTVRQAVVQPIRVESQELEDGIWLIGGGSHNSVAVEFSDFVTVIEAPLNEERSLAVIQEVQRLIPDKMIRYLVVTHHHTDHSGGIRTYVAQGATIVTHEANLDFLDQRIITHTSVAWNQTFCPRITRDSPETTS